MAIIPIPATCPCGSPDLFAHPMNTHNREMRSTVVCCACERQVGTLIGKEEHRRWYRRMDAELAALKATLDASDIAAIADGAVAAARALANGKRAQAA